LVRSALIAVIVTDSVEDLDHSIFTLGPVRDAGFETRTGWEVVPGASLSEAAAVVSGPECWVVCWLDAQFVRAVLDHAHVDSRNVIVARKRSPGGECTRRSNDAEHHNDRRQPPALDICHEPIVSRLVATHATRARFHAVAQNRHCDRWWAGVNRP
jgi:hypothetical protein